MFEEHQTNKCTMIIKLSKCKCFCFISGIKDSIPFEILVLANNKSLLLWSIISYNICFPQLLPPLWFVCLFLLKWIITRASRHDEFPPYKIRPYVQLVLTENHQWEHSLYFLDDHQSVWTREVVINKHKTIDNKSSDTKDNYNMKNVLWYCNFSHVFLSNVLQ